MKTYDLAGSHFKGRGMAGSRVQKEAGTGRLLERAQPARNYRSPSIALLVWASTIDLEGVVRSLRGFGFTPLIRFGGESALPTLLRCHPSVAVVGGGCGDARLLLRSLAHEGVPTILIGDADQLQMAKGLEGVGAAMLAPVDPLEIGQIARTIAGEDAELADEVIEVGELSVDLGRQIAIVEGEPVRLPPREFAILRELSLHVGEPISSADLVRRVWPKDAPVTPVDVARLVYRLRRLIGDNERTVPFISTRRGFGYCIEPRWIV